MQRVRRARFNGRREDLPGDCERRVELEPRWPLRLPGGGADGVMRVRGGVLERLLHVEEPAGARARRAGRRADAC